MFQRKKILKKIPRGNGISCVSMATHNGILMMGMYLSAVSQFRLLNLIPDSSLHIGLSSHGQICKLLKLHIHEY